MDLVEESRAIPCLHCKEPVVITRAHTTTNGCPQLMATASPEAWTGLVQDEDQLFTVAVCSRKCRDAFFKAGG